MWRGGGESWWLGYINIFIEVAIQEGVVNVDLVDTPVMGDSMR